MKTVQNSGLRFVKGIKLKDKKKVSELHEETGIEYLNIRLSRMANKTLNKMKEIHHIPKHKTRATKYKYSDYEIPQSPHKPRKRSLAQRIEKYIGAALACVLPIFVSTFMAP